MRRSSVWVALFLLVLYTGFVIGTQLHFHSGNEANHPDCKLCQFSHVSVIESPKTSLKIEVRSLGYFFEALPQLTAEALPTFAFGRAPPLS